MCDYIELNLKNTKLLIANSTPARYKQLCKSRYSVQLDMFEKYVDKNTPLLDIGIREGFFLEFLREQGFTDLYGIDIFEDGVKLAVDKGFNCEVGDAHKFNLNKKFDVVVISHVLEHCPDPAEVIERIHEHLNTNGVLFVETPKELGEPVPSKKDAHYYNFNSMDDLLYFFDAKWIILEHIVVGTRLRIVLKKRGENE